MQRRRFKQISSLKDRLASFAEGARQKALRLRPGPEKDVLLKEFRRADKATRIDGWANSPGLQPPK